MKQLQALIVAFLCVWQGQAQQDSTELVLPKMNLKGIRSFTYRVINQQYLANENGYFLALTVDTMYLKFSRTPNPMIYTMQPSLAEGRYIPVISDDTFKKVPLILEFDGNGRVKRLQNWENYKRLALSKHLNGRKLESLPQETQNELLDHFNEEGTIRRFVMEDINYIFSLNGDTFDMHTEYIRLKELRSPISGANYMLEGTMVLEKPEGTKNTVLFQATNSAGKEEKPLLMAEAQAFLKRSTPPGQPVSELRNVGWNSEQSYQYNKIQMRMMAVTLSDVLAFDMSSRGNIRLYEFWDLEED